MGQRFTLISNSFIEDTTLSAGAKLVGLMYAKYANKERLAWPSVATLQKLTRLGRDSVKRGRAELVQKRLLEKMQRRGNPHGRFGRVVYRVSAELLARRGTEIQSSGEMGTQKTMQQLTAGLNLRSPGNPVGGKTGGRIFSR